MLHRIHRELTGLDPPGSILAGCALSLHAGRLYIRRRDGAVVALTAAAVPADDPIVGEFRRADAD
jgi:hypothetical protein